jgi:RimJ/RimL family protein N-acetyltransferase
VPSDALAIAQLAGDERIASTTRRIPHPYTLEMARDWIAQLPTLRERQELVNFAITLTNTGELIGSTGLLLNMADFQGELGYWIGVPYWNNGYATEAAQAAVRFAFDDLGLHRVFAFHMARNPASGRVMQKIGLRPEGVLRGHRYKWGQFEDLLVYGMTRLDPRPACEGLH